MSQRVYEALASPVRRQILIDLAAGELGAGEIAARFEMSKPAISQHLTVLEAAELVIRRKQGQFVFYSAAADTLAVALETLLGQTRPALAVAEIAEPEVASLPEPPEAGPASKAAEQRVPLGYRWEAWRTGAG